MNNKINYILVVLVIILAVAITFFATKSYYNSSDMIKTSQEVLNEDVVNETSTGKEIDSDDVDDKMFVSQDLGIAFNYPEEWEGVEVEESRGWMMVKKVGVEEAFIIQNSEYGLESGRGGTWGDATASIEKCSSECSIYKSTLGLEFAESKVDTYWEATPDLPVYQFGILNPNKNNTSIVISNIESVPFDGTNLGLNSKKANNPISREELLVIVNSLEFL